MTRTTALIVFVVAAVLATAPAASAKRIAGTAGDDTLAGTERRDFIFGRAGDDAIAGNGGSDLLFGGRGSDIVTGDDGRDSMWGGPQSDTLEGGAAGDLLHAGRGADSLEGNAGNDILVASEDDGRPDVVDCGAGAHDRAVLRAGDHAVDCERVRTFPSRRSRVVIIRGTRGDDTLTGSEKRDFIVARAGNDIVSGEGARDFLFGQRGDDQLSGDAGSDYAWGGSGDDQVWGGDGPDWLFAGVGADDLWGGEGHDRLFAAADDGTADDLDCGESDGDWDRAVVRPGDTAVNCEKVFTLAS